MLFRKKANKGIPLSKSERYLKWTATIFSLVFAALMLYPMLFAVSSAMKDNAKIYEVPPKLLPDTANSISVVLDYSKESKDEAQLKDQILRDSVLVMMGISYKLPKDSIMEINIYGTKDGETIYYSRAHQMKLQLEKDYGIYKGTTIKKDVVLYEDRYLRASQSIGYSFNLKGVNKKAPTELKTTFQSKVKKLLDEKYQTVGTLLSVGNEEKALLNLETFLYYFQMPAYMYSEHPTIQKFGFMTFIFNSFIVIGFAIVVQVFLCSICAFIISQRLSKRAGRIVLLFFLGAMMVPFASIMLPQLVMYKQMGAYNNYWALLLPFLYPYGFYIYLYKGFFDQIPRSYFEAAELDGAGSLFLYSKICMPLSKPIISLIALQTFIGNWNDFFWAWLVTEDQKLWTLNVALFNISNNVATKQNAMMGLAVLTSMPVILLSILFSKQLKKSIVASGVKG
ncbi:carbohydrate ABC transporter permease [Streptococcus respiraculi]|uniref:carbohydrate ABC transporter permease n=1 Tax=Streptococcus respiraculi TaxID=2021971 RepID=UPI000E728F7A|nr:carbohydrate ABC transporter permease [Streptococcus respiraculi]